VKMLPSTRFIFKRVLFQGIFFLSIVFMTTLFPLWSISEEDSCAEIGIYIRNSTTIDVWYTRNGGPCTFWSDDLIIILKPGEKLAIYRDMTCETAYCPKNPTYDDYKSLDANHNCRVRILPYCTFADM
jgi:hypothetical protein